MNALALLSAVFWLAGATAACTGIAILFGVGWAFIAAGAFGMVTAVTMRAGMSNG